MATIDKVDRATVSGNPGTLNITISPDYAVDDGALGKLMNDTVRCPDPATDILLSPGTYTVSFEQAKGWATPASQNVTIQSDQTTAITGTYVRKPILSSWCRVRDGYTAHCEVRRGGVWRTVTVAELVAGYIIQQGDIVYITNGELFVNVDDIDCYFPSALDSPYWKSIEITDNNGSWQNSTVVPD